jgi:hypothetical protein
VTAALGVLAGALFGLAIAWYLVGAFLRGKALYVDHLRANQPDSPELQRLGRLTALGERMHHLRVVPIVFVVGAIVLVVVAVAT